MKAYLYNKEQPVMQCEIENGKVVKLLGVLDPARMPVMLSYDCTLERINGWLNKRAIPPKREGLREARLAFPGLDANHNMFSLSDQYWFRYNKKETWKDLNFFTNDYQIETGKAFFTPWAVDREQLSRPSPDLTTGGALMKAWVREEGRSYLYKAGSEVYHQEPLSEVLSSMMLEKLGIIPFVRYELAVHGLRMCSKCANFITEDTEFVPAFHIYNREARPLDETHYDHFIRMCKTFDIDLKKARHFMTNMIAADVVICNRDRHLGNFGLIRDVNTGIFIDFAPLFDFGDAYRGTKAAIRGNGMRLFEDKEAWCVQKALKNVDKETLLNTDAMHALVRNYPGIQEAQRGYIDKQVDGIRKVLKEKDLDEFVMN